MYGNYGWSPLDPYRTAWNYWTGGSKSASSGSGSAPKTPKPGYYTEGGYVYQIDGAANITIVANQRGKQRTAVAQGSTAYYAIYNKMVALSPMTTDQLSAAIAKVTGSSAKRTPSGFQPAPTIPQTSMVPPASEGPGIIKSAASKLPYIIVGGLVLGGVAAFGVTLYGMSKEARRARQAATVPAGA